MSELTTDVQDWGPRWVPVSDGSLDIVKWCAEAPCGERSAVFFGTHEALLEVKSLLPGT